MLRPNTTWKLSLKSETSLFILHINYRFGSLMGTYTKQAHFLAPFWQPVIWAKDEWHRHKGDKITCFMVKGCKTHWKLTLMIAFFWLPTLAVHMHSELLSCFSWILHTISIHVYNIMYMNISLDFFLNISITIATEKTSDPYLCFCGLSKTIV